MAFFDYFDKLLIVLSITTGSISIASYCIIFLIGAAVGMTSLSFSLAFSAGVVKNLLNNNNIVMLARRKLNSVERKITEASIDNENSHENFITIINEEKNIEN